jgi:hypothetical protein
VNVEAGGTTGLGYTYGAAEAASLINATLAPIAPESSGSPSSPNRRRLSTVSLKAPMPVICAALRPRSTANRSQAAGFDAGARVNGPVDWAQSTCSC